MGTFHLVEIFAETGWLRFVHTKPGRVSPALALSVNRPTASGESPNLKTWVQSRIDVFEKETNKPVTPISAVVLLCFEREEVNAVADALMRAIP